jgi:hypothetical protein
MPRDPPKKTGEYNVAAMNKGLELCAAAALRVKTPNYTAIARQRPRGPRRRQRSRPRRPERWKRLLISFIRPQERKEGGLGSSRQREGALNPERDNYPHFTLFAGFTLIQI